MQPTHAAHHRPLQRPAGWRRLKRILWLRRDPENDSGRCSLTNISFGCLWISMYLLPRWPHDRQQAQSELSVFSPSVAEKQLPMKGSVLERSQDGMWQPSRLDEVTALLLSTLSPLVRWDHPAVKSLWYTVQAQWHILVSLCTYMSPICLFKLHVFP